MWTRPGIGSSIHRGRMGRRRGASRRDARRISQDRVGPQAGENPGTTAKNFQSCPCRQFEIQMRWPWRRAARFLTCNRLRVSYLERHSLQGLERTGQDMPAPRSGESAVSNRKQAEARTLQGAESWGGAAHGVLSSSAWAGRTGHSGFHRGIFNLPIASPRPGARPAQAGAGAASGPFPETNFESGMQPLDGLACGRSGAGSRWRQ